MSSRWFRCSYNWLMVANDFMGPTLFHSDPAALVDSMARPGCAQGVSGKSCFLTHYDMLHEAPLCMGIAHDPERSTAFGYVYWLFDGPCLLLPHRAEPKINMPGWVLLYELVC